MAAGSERNRRARAAWAYSGHSQAELAKRSGLNAGTLRGYLRKAKPNEPGPDELHAIADACKVPRAFMDHGWAITSAADATELAADVSQLREAVGSLSLVVLQQGQELADLAGKGRRPGHQADGG